jgi:MOSC domain-containing protein YiiM
MLVPFTGGQRNLAVHAAICGRRILHLFYSSRTAIVTLRTAMNVQISKSMTVAQVSISGGGIPKRAVPSAVVGVQGVQGDGHADRHHHGGPDRAVCIFSEELYLWLREEHGIDLPAGSVGENFTTRGLDLAELKVGDRLQAGECTIEITDVRTPCFKLRKWHPDLPRLIDGRSGWMARVISEGTVRAGGPIRMLPR